MISGIHKPDFRFSRVRDLVIQGREPGEYDDITVKQFYRFYSQYNNANPDMLPELLAKFSSFYISQEMYETADDFRWQVEALILANESQQNISKYLALTPHVVSSYEKLFFDIRDRLDAEGYIRAAVLKSAQDKGVTLRDPDLLWKLIGYYFKAEGLYNWWSILGSFTPELEKKFDAAIKKNQQKAALVASISMEPNAYSSTFILSAYNDSKRVDIEQSRLEGELLGPADNKADSLLRGIASSVQWILASADPNKLIDSSADEAPPTELKQIEYKSE